MSLGCYVLLVMSSHILDLRADFIKANHGNRSKELAVKTTTIYGDYARIIHTSSVFFCLITFGTSNSLPIEFESFPVKTVRYMYKSYKT